MKVIIIVLAFLILIFLVLIKNCKVSLLFKHVDKICSIIKKQNDGKISLFMSFSPLGITLSQGYGYILDQYNKCNNENNMIFVAYIIEKFCYLLKFIIILEGFCYLIIIFDLIFEKI